MVADGPADGQVVASVTGELDAASAPLLQQELLQALRRADRLLTVDLSGVTFFGSAGVTALVWVSQHPEVGDRHVQVVATSRVVTGPLELTGLLARLDVQGMPGPRETPGQETEPTGSDPRGCACGARRPPWSGEHTGRQEDPGRERTGLAVDTGP